MRTRTERYTAAVLDWLDTHQGGTVVEIHTGLLRRDGTAPARATIYNHLQDFVYAELVRRHRIGRRFHYALRRDARTHTRTEDIPS